MQISLCKSNWWKLEAIEMNQITPTYLILCSGSIGMYLIKSNSQMIFYKVLDNHMMTRVINYFKETTLSPNLPCT